jgi:hypothetical protein
MMKDFLMRDKRGQAGLFEMLLGFIIMGVLIYIAMHTYFKQGILGAGKPAVGGVNVSTPQTAIDAAKQNVQNLNKQINEQNKQLEILGH